MHLNALLMFDRYVRPHIGQTDTVLELGPDRPVPTTFCERAGHDPKLWSTADISRAPKPTYLMPDPQTLFPGLHDGFDLVFSANVLEHVVGPDRWLQMLARVVRRGGIVAIISPVSWPYHESPVDVARYYPCAMTQMYESAGLAVELCTFCTHEPVGRGFPVPGRSLSHVREPQLKELYARSMEEGGPVECAYDCVTIGRKTY